MTSVNEYLENVVKELEGKDYSDDPAHLLLVQDLLNLLKDAVDFRFHDFHKNSADTPKMELHTRLLELDKKIQEGEYDN